MKILAINSSYRADRGYTAFLINLLFEGARESGAECERIDLAKLRINHCLACNYCQNHTRLVSANPNSEQEFLVECVQNPKDDVQFVFEHMREADLIIYATPIYVFNISSLLKLLFERFYGISNCGFLRATQTGLLFHHIAPAIMSKPFISLIVCDNLEEETPKTALQYFKSFSLFMDARQVGTLIRNGGTLTGWGDDGSDFSRFPKLEDVYAAFRQAGRELAINGQICAATQRHTNQDIVPVPFFSILKKIRLLPLKKKFAEKAREMQLARSK